jgi:hypothetical protein
VAGCVRPLQPGGSTAARLRQAAFFYLLAPDRNALRELALVLSAAAARMEPQDAAKATASLNQAMPKNIFPFPPAGVCPGSVGVSCPHGTQRRSCHPDPGNGHGE